MRVVHILRKYDPAEWGGTETAIHQLATGLAAHGVDSAVYAPALPRPTNALDPFAASGCAVRRFRACLPVWGMPEARRKQLLAVSGNLVSFDLIGALWRERTAAVIHSHVLGRLGAVGLRIARRRRIPFVATVHGGLYDLPPAVRQGMVQGSGRNGLDWGKIVGWLLRSRAMVEEADAIVTCNPREARLIAERHPKLRVMIQPHGVPASRYGQDQREAARRAFPSVQGRTLLLMPGRVDPVKNQDWVAAQMRKLARRHPNILVMSVGPCTDAAYGQALEGRLRAEGLQNHFFLAGKLPPGDPRLIGLLQLAEAVLLPSVSETFGLVILEAWAAGTPVISTRTSGALSLVEPGRDGWLFDLAAPEQFHAAVDELAADPARARARGEAGRARVRRDYDSVVLAGRMQRLYDELSLQVPCAT